MHVQVYSTILLPLCFLHKTHDIFGYFVFREFGFIEGYVLRKIPFSPFLYMPSSISKPHAFDAYST